MASRSADSFKSHHKDPNRKKTLDQSPKIYPGKKCSSRPSCEAICEELFSLTPDREDCLQLPIQQVSQFEKLSQLVLSEELVELQKINFFDLKVLLSLSQEPLFRFFNSLSPFPTKKILYWIFSDWRVAQVFREEDKDFLFLEIFLKKVHFSPIDSLGEEAEKGRTFVEVAWLKQNDPALFWLNDYFKNKECAHLEKEEREFCVFSQYCLLSQKFQDDVAEEFMEFKNIEPILNSMPHLPQSNLKSFCLAFCSNEKGQNYCS